ncbi:hypothetical protein GWK47_044387 [Chionoecetes opilio]|uniref:Uncharacterized protein n=1 Tax=Chionoecetes opilio TaxID=41210 RepID=A0A8J4Y8C6_CHIOP|nr:hypothetical protein GWK47_044387 [Chionoecetes opilio]
MAKSLEERSGRPFLVKGQAVGEYVLDYWHRYHAQRNREKKERQSARTKQLLHETRLGTEHHAVSFKRQLAPEGSVRRTNQRRLQENSSPDPSSTSTICLTPQHLRSRGILREHNQKPLLSIAAEKIYNNVSSQDSSTYSKTLHLCSRRENIRSSAVYGASRTPGPSRRTSPSRPQGLPRTPKTLPRIAPRRSPRLNASSTTQGEIYPQLLQGSRQPSDPPTRPR